MSTVAELYLIAAVFQLALAAFTFTRRDRDAAKLFVALSFSQGISYALSFSQSAGWLGTGTPLLVNLSTESAVIGLALQLLFAISYVKAKVPRWALRAIVIEPILFGLLLITNGWHGLIWATLPTIEAGQVAIENWAAGPYLAVRGIVGLGMLAWAVWLFVRSAWVSRGVFRQQAALLALGPICTVGYVMLLMAGSEVPLVVGVTFLAVGSLLPGLAFVWGLLRLQLLDIARVARAVLVDTVADSMVVVDHQDRVIDMNAAARALLGSSAVKAFGRPLGELARGLTQQDLLADGEFDGRTEQGVRRYETRRFPLASGQRGAPGHLLLIRDITELRDLAAARAENLRVEGVLLAVRTVEHELNNKLTLISGYTQLLLKDMADSTDDAETLGYVVEAAEEAAEAIRKLGSLTEVREKQWGTGLRPTLDLDTPQAA